MFDGEAFGASIVEAVKEHLDEVVAPLMARIAALEAENKALKQSASKFLEQIGEATAEQARAAAQQAVEHFTAEGALAPSAEERAAELDAAIARHFDTNPVQHGKDVTDDQVDAAVARALEPREGVLNPVAEQVARWFEANPPAAGKDADPITEAQVADAVAGYIAANPIPAAKDGADAHPDQIAKAVSDYLEANPVRAGKDADPVADETIARAVAAHLLANPPAAGKDGVGLAGAVIDRDGNLIVTTTAGAQVDLGRVVGKDGEPGFGLDDFDVERPDDRTIRFRFVRGDMENVFDLNLEHPIYRDVYREGVTYERGDVVTWAGSAWHCEVKETTAKPGEGSKDWKLAVKKGRDAK